MKKKLIIGMVVMLLSISMFDGCVEQKEGIGDKEVIRGTIIEIDTVDTAYSSHFLLTFASGRTIKAEVSSVFPLYKDRLADFTFKNLGGGWKRLLSVEYLEESP